MNFPVWEVPFLGGGLLITIVAVVHVIVSHFAVGGGFFLVLTERKAHAENSPSLLAYVKLHSKFFLLLSAVFGAVTGVAIWFVIGLIQPAGTSSLIHSFVWGWAIEWVFFIIEVSSILFYVAMWDRISHEAHMKVGWIYAASGFLTLAVINGIVSFMLTPGDWLATKNFWDGVFNPTYLVSLVTRGLLCVMFAGVYAFLTAVFVKDIDTRALIVRYAAKWVILPVVVLPFAFWWYTTLIPETAVQIVTGGIAYIQLTADYGLYAIILLFLLVVVGPLWKPRSFGLVQAILILLIASGVMLTWERVREAVRKPYVIHGYMYSNGVRVDDVESIQEAGILSSITYVSERTITPENELALGKEIFRATCANCHTVGGYQDVVQYLPERTLEDLDVILSDMPSFRGFMPPFPGNEEERMAVAKYLMTLQPTVPVTEGVQP